VISGPTSTTVEVSPVSEEYEPELALDRIKPSKTNPRRVFEDMERLTASVKASGVKCPILVRPLRTDLPIKTLIADPSTRFELVFGERRYRAAKAAGRSTIPAMVRVLTDAQVIEDQIVENNQRKDIHPLDEADGAIALKNLGMDDATVAEKLGWTESYTAARLRLTHLAPIWRQVWLKGEVGLHTTHANQIARLSEPQQLELHDKLKRSYDWPRAVTNLDLLKRHIFELFHRNLADAPWKLDDVELHKAMGACNACQHNSKYQAALFDDVKGALCLKPDCFATKQQAYVQLQITAVKSSGAEPVMISHNYGKERPKGAVGVHDVVEISKAEAKKLPAAQVKTAVVVDGEDAGKTVVVRVNPTAASASKSTNDAAARQRRAEQKAKRDTALNHVLLTAILEKADPVSLPATKLLALEMFERMSSDDRKRFVKRHGWEKPSRAGFGDNWLNMLATDHVEGLRDDSPLTFALEAALVPCCHVHPTYASDGSKKLVKIAELFKVDVDRVREKFNAAQDQAATPTAKPIKKPAKKGGRK
jgi:ParB/RepB/Spo0J family partition protein